MSGVVERASCVVLVLAPLGRDAQLAARVLTAAGIAAETCADAAELCERMERGAGCAIVTEEALTAEAMERLGATLARQEPWSDFPIVVFGATHQRGRPLEWFRRLGNARVLDRPIAPRILVSAVEAALRGRRRQYAAEAERRRSETELRGAEEFQQRLIGIAGHDLRNPLASIQMSATLLARGAADDKQRAHAERIRANAKRMNRIVSDLVDYTRARMGSAVPLLPRDADFHLICQAVLDEMHGAWPARAIAYEAEGDPTGHWDADRLEQVLVNLLVNAVKYGDPAAPISLRWWRIGRDDHGEDLVFEVHNTGAPIPEALLPTVFEPFRLGDQTASSGTRSLGLGLFIVREIVRAHRGEVAVASRAAEGTTFHVRIPRRAAPR